MQGVRFYQYSSLSLGFRGKEVVDVVPLWRCQVVSGESSQLLTFDLRVARVSTRSPEI
jgi:hypothetical protein